MEAAVGKAVLAVLAWGLGDFEMAQTKRATAPTGRRGSVLSRVIRPDRDDLSAEAARSILNLHFDDEDLERMHELAVKNQGGGLTSDEQQELAEYRQVGLLLDLLKARARLSLRKLGASCG